MLSTISIILLSACLIFVFVKLVLSSNANESLNDTIAIMKEDIALHRETRTKLQNEQCALYQTISDKNMEVYNFEQAERIFKINAEKEAYTNKRIVKQLANLKLKHKKLQASHTKFLDYYEHFKSISLLVDKNSVFLPSAILCTDDNILKFSDSQLRKIKREFKALFPSDKLMVTYHSPVPVVEISISLNDLNCDKGIRVRELYKICAKLFV